MCINKKYKTPRKHIYSTIIQVLQVNALACMNTGIYYKFNMMQCRSTTTNILTSPPLWYNLINQNYIIL